MSFKEKVSIRCDWIDEAECPSEVQHLKNGWLELRLCDGEKDIVRHLCPEHCTTPDIERVYLKMFGIKRNRIKTIEDGE